MTHQPDFSGCWAKVSRAEVHLEFFHERVKSLVTDGRSYKIETKPDVPTGEVIVYGEAFGEPPIEELGAIIGDVVHNLRSALDHLVWQLTIAEQGPPPNPIPWKGPGRRWKDIAFPIYYAFTPRFTKYSGPRKPWSVEPPDSLWGVWPGLRADFEALQPFITGKHPGKTPAAEPLAVLHELWNTDKHRHLHLVSFFIGLHDVRSVKPFTADPMRALMPEVKLRVVQKRPPGPFKGRAELGRVSQVGERRTPLLEVYVQPDLAFDIAFQKGSPANGERVMETLVSLYDAVASVIIEFETKFP